MGQTYLPVTELQLAVGGSIGSINHVEDYTRAIAAATSQIDRWTGRRFVRDDVTSQRPYVTWSADWVCVGDYTDPTDLLVETDDAGDGTWSPWDPSEWQPGADDRGNGRFVRLDGEPWRWITPTGTRKFPISTGCEPRVRATTHWGWDVTPNPVREACLELAILYFQPKDRTERMPQMLDTDPVLLARGLLMDYAVEGGTIYCRPLVG